MKTLGQVVKETRDQMVHAALPNASAQAQWLVAEICGFGPFDYVLYPNRKLEDDVVVAIEQGVARLIQGLPLEYVVGSVSFDGLRLEVGPEVLIPRPETEELVQKVASIFANRENESLDFVDLGTGSGCLVISLARRFPCWKAHASDVSEEALKIARRNAKQTGVDVDFRQGSWIDPWISLLGVDSKNGNGFSEGKVFDLVVSNPPYIASSEQIFMSPSTLKYEPHLALFADEEGLAVYKLLSKQLLKITRPGSIVAFEMGFCQAEAIFEFFNTDGWRKASVFKDLSGHQRFFFVERE